MALKNNVINATGERFIPEVQDEELTIEHLERYECVKELVRDKIVLDAACGEGYGSQILSRTAACVLGIDIDVETIDRARNKYGESKKLSYRQASVTDLSIVPSASIEVVVSYETIEHIDGESQIKFLDEIARVLKPDGILIMSTPDKREYSDKYHYHNKFHIKEFYVSDFLDFLHVKFQNVKLYNQYLEVASFVDNPDEVLERIQYCINREEYKAVAKYVIAVASNSGLPDQSIAMAYTHLRREYMPMMEELNYCRKEAIQCRRKVEKLDECLNENRLIHEEMDRRAVELNHRMDEINLRDREITRQKNKINFMDQEIDRQKNEISLLKGEMDRRAVELDHRMDEINLRNQEIDRQKNEISLLKEEIDRRAVELDHRMSEINLKDQEIDRQKNELKLSKEEMDKRAVELDYRMDEINLRDQEIDRQKNEISLLKGEMDRRAVELDHRMDEINLRDQEIDRQKNELKLVGEEMNRRAAELEYRMDKINELQMRWNHMNSLNLSGVIKWYIERKNK